MNIISIIILVTITSDIILHAVADFLNLKQLKNRLPDEFKDLYDADQYRKSQEYLRVNTRFGWITSTVDTAAILLIWFAKGFPFLDHWVRSFNHGPVITGLLYMGTLILLTTVLSLPFSIYATFVIEERFGFNKTTWSVFITDRIKGLVLGLLLGVPLLAGILSFFEYAGADAWWWCWIGVTIFTLLVQFIAPTWIMPLFNKFKPIEEGELKDAVMSYARSINYPLENVFVMDGSKRSSKSNAFFTGFGKHKRIALFDTIIGELKIPELVAVLAHEIGHYKKKHIQLTLIIGILQMGIMFFLLSLFLSYRGLFDAFYMDQMSVYAGLIFFGILYSPIDFIMGIFLQIFLRKNEFEADSFAAVTTGNPLALAEALKKLSVSSLSNLAPHPFYVFLNYSHPSMVQRLKALGNK
jgi:STE24 endopeptidase